VHCGGRLRAVKAENSQPSVTVAGYSLVSRETDAEPIQDSLGPEGLGYTEVGASVTGVGAGSLTGAMEGLCDVLSLQMGSPQSGWVAAKLRRCPGETRIRAAQKSTATQTRSRQHRDDDPTTKWSRRDRHGTSNRGQRRASRPTERKAEHRSSGGVRAGKHAVGSGFETDVARPSTVDCRPSILHFPSTKRNRRARGLGSSRAISPATAIRASVRWKEPPRKQQADAKLGVDPWARPTEVPKP
jgi:hypothetical protein